MDKIKWCLEVKNGIEIVKPNPNLAEAYLKKAEESLESMRSIKNKDWKISTAYYTMYFSLYAILMKIGIKCEIHSCTIEVIKRFLDNYFNEQECKLIEKSSKTRIDAQYYINRKISDNIYTNMIKNASRFLIKCKSIVSKLNEKEIMNIRNKIIKIKEKS